MYLPPLIARLLPLFANSSPSSSSSTSATTDIKTFRPIKAHTTHSDNQSLLWHDASGNHSLQDLRALELDGHAAMSVLDDGEPIDPPPLVLRTRRIPIMRPRHSPLTASWRNLTFSERSSLLSAAPDWEEIEVEAPDVTDRKTLLALAMMSSNAYIEPNSTDWYSLDKWNAVSNQYILADVKKIVAAELYCFPQSVPFGWEKDADGLRGHIVRLMVSHRHRIMKWMATIAYSSQTKPTRQS